MKVFVAFLVASFLLAGWSARRGRVDRFAVLLGMSVLTAVLLFSNRLA
jgi:hypothetical protein